MEDIRSNSNSSYIDDRLEWSISVPVFKNPIILKQLAIAIGIPFGIVALILIIATNDFNYLLYAFGLIAALFILTYLVIQIVWHGKYDVCYVLDSKGISCSTQEKQYKRNRVINNLLIVFGLFSGKPGYAGTGMLANSRQKEFFKWKSIRKIKYQPQQNTIIIRGGWTEQTALFCSPENYPQIEAYVRSKIRI